MTSPASDSSLLYIDIVIPTYKRGGRAYQVAVSVLKQCLPRDRVFIVSQGIDTIDFPANPHLRLINRTEANLPAGRNHGIFEGNNPIILFLDDDVVVDDNLLDAHRNCYQNSTIGAVAGFIDDPMFQKENNLPSRFDYCTGKLVQNFSSNKSQFTISMMGANMSLRRDVLKKVGVFDTNYQRNALWEEIDIAFRILAAGYAIWFCSDAKVKHCRDSYGGCRADTSKRYLFYMFSNTTYFACTFTPLQCIFGWIQFWKNRLEYECRIKSAKKNMFSHDILMVVAGVCGIAAGLFKFIFSGKRVGLPDSVRNFSSESK